MGTLLATFRRLFASPVSRASSPSGIPPTDVECPGACEQPVVPSAQIPQVGVRGTAFVPSFKPFKAEKKLEGRERIRSDGSIDNCNYPHSYYNLDLDDTLRSECFRSPVEVEWAEAFDRLGLQWEYEPLKFDMGPKHFSYTPDFKVAGLSIPDSNRPLYIEVKWFGEDMDLTKYVRFTEWYNCDLLVLAHYDRNLWERAKRWRARPRPNVLKPEKERYFLVLKCTQCNAYDWFPYNEFPSDDYIRLVERRPRKPYSRRKSDYYEALETFPFGYRLEPDGTFWLTTERDHPSACQEQPIERIVVPDNFLIQAGTVGRGRVVLPEETTSGRQISYICP